VRKIWCYGASPVTRVEIRIGSISVSGTTEESRLMKLCLKWASDIEGNGAEIILKYNKKI
jgi:hypothetical protein